MKRLKVLFITHNYIRFKGDFAGVFLHLLALKLREEGIEVVVVAPHDSGTEEFEEIDGVRIYRFRYAVDDKETFAYRGDMHRQVIRNPFRIFGLIKFLKAEYRLACKVIEKEGIGTISVQWVIPNGVPAHFLKRKYKEKLTLFISSHGTDIRLLTGTPLVFTLFRPLIRESAGWTVVSNYLKNLLVKKDRGLRDKLHVIPLPNDEALFFPEEKTVKEPYLIVAVSRLTVQKRLNYLLEAIRRLAVEFPEIKLEIYGAGPEKIPLEELIRELGLIGRAKIINPLPQEGLRTVYNRAAAVVLNSIGEGFGLALTEAMLCRTAVIGTASGGITDIIDDGTTGLLVPPDDSGRLGDAIRRLLLERDFRDKLAQAGYEKALKCFSAKASAQEYALLFEGKKD
ncbi:putative Glycosyl transferase group 1 [Candidatus Zixiibacteriota bacterium]|nr:putative Glycosyl transferase group 1 [candidate division Zixibacteria bacterium]